MTQNPFDTRSPYERLERARRERLFQAICNASITFAVPLILLLGLLLINEFAWQTMLALIMGTLIIPISLYARRLAQYARVRQVSTMLLISFLVIIALNSLLIDGLFPIAALGFVLIIVLSGMLLQAKVTYMLTGLAAVLWLVAWYITENGLIMPAPLPASLSGISLIVITILTFAFVSILSQVATSDLRRALDDAMYDMVQANRKLEESNKLKSQFMARTSHELRTPLNSIIGYTDMALHKVYGPLTELQRDGLARVLRNAKRLQAIINDILDLVKIETGEIELSEGVVAIHTLVDMVQSVLTPPAQKKEIELVTTLSSDMPEQIVGDENRLCQVLLHLADNAIKFTEEGKVSVDIRLLDDEHWKITVQDTGRGIHAASLETIFDEFHLVNLRDTNTRTSGTGLGLVITRHLVELMGGEIRVQSEIGDGSTFEVILPLRVPEFA